MLSSVLRRSFLRVPLNKAGADWIKIADTEVAGHVPGENPQAGAVLRDLSPLPRTGFKGAESPAWMEAQGVVLPSTPNLATLQPDGSLVARLAPGEFLILSPLNTPSPSPGERRGGGDLDADPPSPDLSPASPLPNLPPDGGGATDPARTSFISRLDQAWSLDTAGLCFQVPRRDSHAWLHLSGPQVPALFAKICGVDLRPKAFADLAIAQTSVARLSAIVIRDDRGGSTPQFHLLADSASAIYLWDSLVDAMAEFAGSIAGYASLGHRQKG
jgi:sarcosine oxidase subunit gamma